MERVPTSDEKVSDLEGEISAPKSPKKYQSLLKAFDKTRAVVEVRWGLRVGVGEEEDIIGKGSWVEVALLHVKDPRAEEEGQNHH